jgi:hypothetical protein
MFLPRFSSRSSLRWCGTCVEGSIQRHALPAEEIVLVIVGCVADKKEGGVSQSLPLENTTGTSTSS